MKTNRRNKFIALIGLSLVLVGCGQSNQVDKPADKPVLIQKEEQYVNGPTITDEVLDKTIDVATDVKNILTDLGKQAFGEAKKIYEEVKDYDYNKPAVESTPSNWEATVIQELGLQDHREIKVDGGDTNPNREKNVKVNIGFGDRVYWAFTNEHGQLIAVVAEQIIVQDDDTEPVKSSGRYYDRMANVPGTESSEYDRGHVVADSLGGVANAYNITPQQYVVNRHGDQAYMERGIRQAGGASELVALIEYPDTKTQIPTHYTFNYILKGNRITDSFPNANPED